MDLEEFIRKEISARALDQETEIEEHEKGPEEKEIEEMNAKAHILANFLTDTVGLSFVEAMSAFHTGNCLCDITFFDNDQTNTLDAIQLTFSLTEGTKEDHVDHDDWPHLKYKGSLYFHLGNYTNDEIETEFLLPSGKREIKSGSETIDSISRKTIENDIKYAINPNWENE
jgi:hypothetical protein